MEQSGQDKVCQYCCQKRRKKLLLRTNSLGLEVDDQSSFTDASYNRVTTALSEQTSFFGLRGLQSSEPGSRSNPLFTSKLGLRSYVARNVHLYAHLPRISKSRFPSQGADPQTTNEPRGFSKSELTIDASGPRESLERLFQFERRRTRIGQSVPPLPPGSCLWGIRENKNTSP
ncbi:hypothetical protein FA10DRAFT_14350 [Acaromyces ingoldii]|uniref:Uncharacterized protein n=1 Tax=Acaromyces ingoldii TaxID=215250 RepID=A0A316YZ75_9BASI|nr:hypothetical protein FA10DRAFT_14350 [Acaromyces ingoldii]PWN93125.1 hypothetical protein FA10DRAFT_14350 [Acaromyces ingoldii]